jgi:hypothetical protein
MSENLETGSFWCENSSVGMKTNFHVNLTFETCFHTKSTRFHIKVSCELNPCFFLIIHEEGEGQGQVALWHVYDPPGLFMVEASLRRDCGS